MHLKLRWRLPEFIPEALRPQHSSNGADNQPSEIRPARVQPARQLLRIPDVGPAGHSAGVSMKLGLLECPLPSADFSERGVGCGSGAPGAHREQRTFGRPERQAGKSAVR